MRGVPIRARMVRPRAKSVTCVARTATGKSGGMSPADDPVPETALHQRRAARDRALHEPLNLASFTSGATHTIRQPRADPFSVALSTAYLRKPAIESRSLCGDSSAFAARAPFFSAYVLMARKNIARLSPKMAYRLGRPHPSRRRDRQSSLRRSLSTRTPESPFPAPPFRRSCAVDPAA